MSRSVILTFLAIAGGLVLSAENAGAQMGYTHYSLESRYIASDLVVQGIVISVKDAKEQLDPDATWLDVTVEIKKSYKDDKTGTVAYSVRDYAREGLEEDRKSEEEKLWFFKPSGKENSSSADRNKMIHRYPFYPAFQAVRLDRKAKPRPGEETVVLGMNFTPLKTGEELVEAITKAVKETPADAENFGMRIPRIVMGFTGKSGDANIFVVPSDKRLESVAHRIIETPELLLNPLKTYADPGDSEAVKSTPYPVELSSPVFLNSGIEALQFFPSPENVERLKKLLDHPAATSRNGSDEKVYFIREAAYEVLQEWDVDIEKPELILHPDKDPE